MRRAKTVTEESVVISPSTKVKDALIRMKSLDAGLLPVFEEGQVVGMLSIRDIAINVVNLGRRPDKTFVSEVMKKIDGFEKKSRIQDQG